MRLGYYLVDYDSDFQVRYKCLPPFPTCKQQLRLNTLAPVKLRIRGWDLPRMTVVALNLVLHFVEVLRQLVQETEWRR